MFIDSFSRSSAQPHDNDWSRSNREWLINKKKRLTGTNQRIIDPWKLDNNPHCSWFQQKLFVFVFVEQKNVFNFSFDDSFDCLRKEVVLIMKRSLIPWYLSLVSFYFHKILLKCLPTAFWSAFTVPGKSEMWDNE